MIERQKVKILKQRQHMLWTTMNLTFVTMSPPTCNMDCERNYLVRSIKIYMVAFMKKVDVPNNSLMQGQARGCCPCLMVIILSCFNYISNRWLVSLRPLSLTSPAMLSKWSLHPPRMKVPQAKSSCITLITPLHRESAWQRSTKKVCAQLPWLKKCQLE